ncbi:MAG: maltose ABC transporter substrate-binding protein [Spirochaetales bacterium]|nr:maltose ABC transporter substrate-binding protein [Spirochaetales bacterium]
MKKHIGLMAGIVCLSAVLLSSCGEKKVTLKMWESDGPEREFMEWAAAEYKKSHPNIDIVYEPVASPDARAKIELDGPAGVGADVFVAPHDHVGALVAGGHVLPVSDTSFINSFVDAAKVAGTYEGKLYGYPLSIETYALFYNKDIIQNPPKTWDEVISFAKTWNDKSKNKYALVWGVGNAYYSYMFMSAYGSSLFGPNGDDKNQHNINAPATIKGLEYFKNLRSQILDVPSADLSDDFCNSAFVEGTAPMIITGPWKIADFNQSGVNYGITTIPGFGDGKPATSFSGVRIAFVSAYTEHKEEAEDFAKFLMSKEALTKRFEITAQIPPRSDIIITDPLSNGILEQAAYAFPMPTIPQMGTYWSAMGSAYGGIWDGDDVTQDLNAAATAMEAAK